MREKRNALQIRGLGGEELWARYHLEDIEMEVRTLLKQILKKGVGWINLAQDRGMWRAAVNLSFSKYKRNILISLGFISFSKRAVLHGFC